MLDVVGELAVAHLQNEFLMEEKIKLSENFELP